MLENVKNLLSDGVTALGGILIVFGLVNLGLTIKDGMQGGGGQLSGALAMTVINVNLYYVNFIFKFSL